MPRSIDVSRKNVDANRLDQVGISHATCLAHATKLRDKMQENLLSVAAYLLTFVSP